MRICFVSRRFFPTISGMSVYALNLLRQLVSQGHDVTMISQHYGGEAASVYGDGPPMPVDGVEIIGMESVGEQTSGDFEADIDRIVDVIEAQHAERPFDVIHAQYGYPTGLAALLASRRTGVPNVVSIQGGDGHWVGECCATHRDAMHVVLDHAGAVLIGSDSFARAVSERLGTPMERFTIVPGAVNVDRFRPADRPVGSLADARRRPACSTTAASTGAKACSTCSTHSACCATKARTIRLVVSGIGPDVRSCRRARSVARADRLRRRAGHRVVRGGSVALPTGRRVRQSDLRRGVFQYDPRGDGERVAGRELRCRRRGRLPRATSATPCSSRRARPRRWPAHRAHARRQSAAPRLAQTALDEARTRYSWQARGRQIAGIYADLQGTTPDLRLELRRLRSRRRASTAPEPQLL